MSHALIIARRELRERSFVLIAAVVLGLVPFLFALLPIGRRLGPTTMVAGAASVIAPLLTISLALILGASIVGRELSEWRMSFYFARPVSAIAIWGGKVIAALVLIVLTFGIALMPSYAFAYRAWNQSVLPWVMTYTLGAALIYFLLAHFVSVIVRSRSPLAFIDLLLAVAAVLAVTMIVRPLFHNFAFLLARWMIVYLVASLCATILVAGAWQLSRGRTDPRANHRELSRATWILFGSFILLAAAYVGWVFSAKPSDITKVSAMQAPGGEWLVASGEARMRGDFHPVFIMNRHSGEWLRFPEARWNGATFTRTGTAAFAIQPFETAKSRAGELFIQKLGANRARIATGITASSPWAGITLSDDETRVAILDEGMLSISDLQARALLASVRLPFKSKYMTQMFFADPNTVRIYNRGDDSILRVYQFEVGQRSLTLTGQVAIKTMRQLQVSADGASLLIRTFGADPKIHLADARTAQIRKTLDTTDISPSTFLSDGRIAVISNGHLRLFSSDGALQREVPIGNVERGNIIDLGRPDKVVVSVWRGPSARNLMVIDIQRGVIEREEHKGRFGNAANWLDPRQPEPTRTGELVITDSEGRVWRWNALTGEKTKLLGR